MNVDSQHTRWLPLFVSGDHHFGGDQSPLNDSDADEDTGLEGDIDLEELGLEEFVDADKLDSTVSGDVGSSSLS